MITNNCKGFVFSSSFSVDLTVTFKSNANPNKNILLFFLGLYRAVGKRGTEGAPAPYHFQEQIVFSHVKSEHLEFLHVKNIVTKVTKSR